MASERRPTAGSPSCIRPGLARFSRAIIQHHHHQLHSPLPQRLASTHSFFAYSDPLAGLTFPHSHFCSTFFSTLYNYPTPSRINRSKPTSHTFKMHFSTSYIIAASQLFAVAFGAPLFKADAATARSLVARAGYKVFGGDGTTAQGWPAESEWASFEEIW